MYSQPQQPKTHPADFLLSWDRLGFRLLFFGGLSAVWGLQGILWNRPWQEAIRLELGGMTTWAFLAPLVLFVGKRIQQRKVGWVMFLVLHALGMVLVFIPHFLLRQTIDFLWTLPHAAWSQWTTMIPTFRALCAQFLSVPFVYGIITLGSVGMRQAQARREQELQAELLGGQLAEARLALLQRQLNPHFLFNALQAVSTLMHRDPMNADRVLVRLSALLRAMLDDADDEELSLSKELELTRRYLEIEQVRFEDRLIVEWAVAPDLEARVPSLVLLPLVENAIRHGLSTKIGQGHLKIIVRAEQETLYLIVEDDGMGASMPPKLGVGIGNTKERLKTLYGEKAGIEIETPTDGGFRAKIHMPLLRVSS